MKKHEILILQEEDLLPKNRPYGNVEHIGLDFFDISSSDIAKHSFILYRYKDGRTKLLKDRIGIQEEIVGLFDERVNQLSSFQSDLMKYEVVLSDDFNEISEMIETLKHFLLNCKSYKQVF
jgi:hypothetical protein